MYTPSALNFVHVVPGSVFSNIVTILLIYHFQNNYISLKLLRSKKVDYPIVEVEVIQLIKGPGWLNELGRWI